MTNCGQACPYNTLNGCKVKEHNAICPLTNTAIPITEYRITNADRIRTMSDDELAKALYGMQKEVCTHIAIAVGFLPEELDFADESPDILNWLQQPFEGE